MAGINGIPSPLRRAGVTNMYPTLSVWGATGETASAERPCASRWIEVRPSERISLALETHTAVKNEHSADDRGSFFVLEICRNSSSRFHQSLPSPALFWPTKAAGGAAGQSWMACYKTKSLLQSCFRRTRRRRRMVRKSSLIAPSALALFDSLDPEPGEHREHAGDVTKTCHLPRV